MESRLAALTVDTEEVNKLLGMPSNPDLPSTFQPQQIVESAKNLPPLFNVLNVRRAIIPAANGHMSARALARYYAALAEGGKIPPPHSSASEPPLGSHPHIPKFSSQESSKTRRKKININIPLMKRTDKSEENSGLEELHDNRSRNTSRDGFTRVPTDCSSSDSSNACTSEGVCKRESHQRTHISSGKMFENPRIIDEFLGAGDYKNLTLPGGSFGLGFKRFSSKDGSSIVFGHSGMGGSTGFCDVTNKFSIAVTLNKVSIGVVTAKIVNLVCSELNIPVPDEFSRFEAGPMGPDSASNYGAPIIN